MFVAWLLHVFSTLNRTWLIRPNKLFNVWCTTLDKTKTRICSIWNGYKKYYFSRLFIIYLSLIYFFNLVGLKLDQVYLYFTKMKFGKSGQWHWKPLILVLVLVLVDAFCIYKLTWCILNLQSWSLPAVK